MFVRPGRALLNPSEPAVVSGDRALRYADVLHARVPYRAQLTDVVEVAAPV